MDNNRGTGAPFWSCAGFTLFSALVSATFSVLALRMMGTGHQHEYALYAASRSVALVFAILFAIIIRSWRGVAAMAVAMSFVQAFDTVIGFELHNPGQAYGPLAFTVINIVLLLWMATTSARHEDPPNPIGA